jgi:hypothetical protein
MPLQFFPQPRKSDQADLGCLLDIERAYRGAVLVSCLLLDGKAPDY